MRYSKKVICIGIVKVATFLLIFVMLFHEATDLFRTKVNIEAVKPIYGLPKNSVDVLLLGTSHMAKTISPMDLWNDYGITSFNGGTDSQAIAVSYFMLRNFLSVQYPKVVVLEIFFVYEAQITANREQRLHCFVDNAPFSLDISDAIETLIEDEHDKTEYYLNFYTFHNRWKELSKSDFKPPQGWNKGSLTVNYIDHSVPGIPSIVSESETQKPPEIPVEYLYKIIELCREKDIPLIFMVQPCSINASIQKMMNYVCNVAAEEEGVPYINFFYLMDEIGFDFTEDMAEWSHVNYSGAKKLTSYLGEYLQTNYNLQDHRTEPEIADLWNKDYETFARELNNIMMKTAANTDEYFDYLQNQDYILAWNAYSETPLSETALPDFLKTAGINRPQVRQKQYYTAVTQGGELLYRKVSDDRPNDSYMTADTLFSFGDGITGSTNPIGVHAGKKEYSIGKSGLNLLVYDPVSRTVVDNVNINLDTGDISRK